MADTKRGRERNGQKKREQLIKQEIHASLGPNEEPTEPAEEAPEVTDTDLDHVSVTNGDESLDR
ncbi:MAG: hypothetical protein KGY43_02945 [Halodesulfurarchaeum sp.]|nr:hypothetical protein [Halodesulfurarchaeum sp.]